MNTAIHPHDGPIAPWLRGMGRASAVVLFLVWLTLLIAEVIRNTLAVPPVDVMLQGAALGVVFAGYAIGWRHELVGGLMAIAGTAAFFVIEAFTIATISGISAVALFAVPGVLYVLAWKLDQEPSKHLWRLL